jgi:hypothetical protein
LFLSSRESFRYYLPATPGQEEIFYIPYWRFKGSSFFIQGLDVSSEFVDTSKVALDVPELPFSLGIRPQALKLRFVVPRMQGRILSHLPFSACSPSSSKKKTFIGEMVSLIYAPFFFKNGIIHDAILNRPVDGWRPSGQEKLLAAADALPWKLTARSTLCPQCGWDLEGEKNSLALMCRNCSTIWTCTGEKLESQSFEVIAAGSQVEKPLVYLPFWRIHADIKGIDLASCADLIRFANLAKPVTEKAEQTSLAFWTPAFKIKPITFLHWATHMTTTQPEWTSNSEISKESFSPVTLPAKEATEAVVMIIARLMADKRELSSTLANTQISSYDACLVYHPFIVGPSELIHVHTGLAIDRASFSFGNNM